MQWKRIVAVVLLMGLVFLGWSQVEPFRSYADESAVKYISRLNDKHQPVGEEEFADQAALLNYYEGIFDDIRTRAKDEVDQLVDSIQMAYGFMEVEERDNPISQAKLVSEFVFKAKSFEDFIQEIVDHYLADMETDLMTLGVSKEERKEIIGKFKKDSLDIWQRNLIIDALDHMIEEEQ